MEKTSTELMSASPSPQPAPGEANVGDCGDGAKCAAMAWTWRPEDQFLEMLKDSLARRRSWRHRGIAWRWPGARGRSGRGAATGRGGTTRR
uniref:Uncharacterized protein n=1 Tax=Oryza meridionalis TaxID=40149 RepID=A0A0E0D3A2_9ORYZ